MGARCFGWIGTEILRQTTFGNRVYSYGHRNPQGLTFSDSGHLYLSEHGPANDDEVNRIVAGATTDGRTLRALRHPRGSVGVRLVDTNSAHRGVDPDRGAMRHVVLQPPSIPEWENTLLLLKQQHLKVLHWTLQAKRWSWKKMWQQEMGQLRDVLVAPNGRVFLATSNREINGWDFLAQDLDDRVVEVVNSDFDYEVLVPRPIQCFWNRWRPKPPPWMCFPTRAHRRERALGPRGGRGVVQAVRRPRP